MTACGVPQVRRRAAEGDACALERVLAEEVRDGRFGALEEGEEHQVCDARAGPVQPRAALGEHAVQVGERRSEGLQRDEGRALRAGARFVRPAGDAQPPKHGRLALASARAHGVAARRVALRVPAAQLVADSLDGLHRRPKARGGPELYSRHHPLWPDQTRVFGVLCLALEHVPPKRHRLHLIRHLHLLQHQPGDLAKGAPAGAVAPEDDLRSAAAKEALPGLKEAVGGRPGRRSDLTPRRERECVPGPGGREEGRAAGKTHFRRKECLQRARASTQSARAANELLS